MYFVQKTQNQGKEKDTSVFCCDIGGVGKAGETNAGCVSFLTTHIVSNGIQLIFILPMIVFSVSPLFGGKFRYALIEVKCFLLRELVKITINNILILSLSYLTF